jgi:DNA-binding MarR family transcriptional regulator
MDQTNLGTKFYISLLRFLLSAKQHIIAIGSEHGLSGIQAITLLLLEENAACPMKQLGKVFHCDASNITGIVDGLENKGLVTRESDPNDRRVKTICICPAGRKLRNWPATTAF